MPMLARMVLAMAQRLGASPTDAVAVGEAEGAARAARYDQAPSALEALVADLDRLGFDPDRRRRRRRRRRSDEP